MLEPFDVVRSKLFPRSEVAVEVNWVGEGRSLLPAESARGLFIWENSMGYLAGEGKSYPRCRHHLHHNSPDMLQKLM
jgi:hypothetical protein